MKSNRSLFRQFCLNKWYEHRDEIFDWTGTPVEYTSRDYFKQHKWTLKRWFVEQYAEDHSAEIGKSLKRSFKRGNL